MPSSTFTMRSRVWRDKEVEGWHFVTLPARQSAEIHRRFGSTQKTPRPIPVVATVGRTSWKSSLYRIPNSGRYVLALKADVRKKEKIEADRVIAYSVKIAS